MSEIPGPSIVRDNGYGEWFCVWPKEKAEMRIEVLSNNKIKHILITRGELPAGCAPDMIAKATEAIKRAGGFSAAPQIVISSNIKETRTVESLSKGKCFGETKIADLERKAAAKLGMQIDEGSWKVRLDPRGGNIECEFKRIPIGDPKPAGACCPTPQNVIDRAKELVAADELIKRPGFSKKPPADGGSKKPPADGGGGSKKPPADGGGSGGGSGGSGGSGSGGGGSSKGGGTTPPELPSTRPTPPELGPNGTRPCPPPDSLVGPNGTRATPPNGPPPNGPPPNGPGSLPPELPDGLPRIPGNTKVSTDADTIKAYNRSLIGHADIMLPLKRMRELGYTDKQLPEIAQFLKKSWGSSVTTPGGIALGNKLTYMDILGRIDMSNSRETMLIYRDLLREIAPEIPGGKWVSSVRALNEIARAERALLKAEGLEAEAVLKAKGLGLSEAEELKLRKLTKAEKRFWRNFDCRVPKLKMRPKVPVPPPLPPVIPPTPPPPPPPIPTVPKPPAAPCKINASKIPKMPKIPEGALGKIGKIGVFLGIDILIRVLEYKWNKKQAAKEKKKYEERLQLLIDAGLAKDTAETILGALVMSSVTNFTIGHLYESKSIFGTVPSEQGRYNAGFSEADWAKVKKRWLDQSWSVSTDGKRQSFKDHPDFVPQKPNEPEGNLDRQIRYNNDLHNFEKFKKFNLNLVQWINGGICSDKSILDLKLKPSILKVDGGGNPSPSVQSQAWAIYHEQPHDAERYRSFQNEVYVNSIIKRLKEDHRRVVKNNQLRWNKYWAPFGKLDIHYPRGKTIKSGSFLAGIITETKLLEKKACSQCGKSIINSFKDYIEKVYEECTHSEGATCGYHDEKTMKKYFSDLQESVQNEFNKLKKQLKADCNAQSCLPKINGITVQVTLGYNPFQPIGFQSPSITITGTSPLHSSLPPTT